MGYARGYTPILKDTSMVVFYDKVYFPQSLCGNTWQDTDLSGSPRDRTEQMNIRHGHWLRDGNLEPWPMADGPKGSISTREQHAHSIHRKGIGWKQEGFNKKLSVTTSQFDW